MRDMQGHELKEGDLVHVKVGNEWIVGHVLKVQNGGIAVTGVPKNRQDPVGVTMDALVVQLAIGFSQQPPGANHVMVLKLESPQVPQNLLM